MRHLEYGDEPHNRPRPTFFFHGFKIEDDGKASCTIPPRNLLRTPVTVPTKETAPLTSRFCPTAGPHWHKQRRWCFDTCSNLSSHSIVDLRFSAGSTGERTRLHMAPHSCTCKLSGRDAVMVLSLWLWIFSSGVPRPTSTSDGPMDIFRYMKTLRSFLAIAARLIRLAGFFAFGIEEIKNHFTSLRAKSTHHSIQYCKLANRFSLSEWT